MKTHDVAGCPALRSVNAASTVDGRLPRSVAEAFIPVVRGVARALSRHLPPHVSAEDLAGAGYVALVELYARGEVRDAEAFEPLARVRIRGAMLDYLRRADPLTRRARRGLRRAHAARSAIESTCGRAATHEEVQRALGMTRDAYERLLARASFHVGSLDVDDAHEVQDEHAPTGHDAFEALETQRSLRRAFDALPPRLQHVLDLYYGDELTLRAVGRILGVSEGRASQLVSKAVGKLRGACVTDMPTAA